MHTTYEQNSKPTQARIHNNIDTLTTHTYDIRHKTEEWRTKKYNILHNNEERIKTK